MICREMYKLQQERKMRAWIEGFTGVVTLILAII